MTQLTTKEQQQAFVEQSLGDSVICPRCSATLATFSNVCTADLQDQCPGFMAIERAKQNFSKQSDRQNCPDCRAAKRHAYSDATTPGFFYTTCDRHRESEA